MRVLWEFVASVTCRLCIHSKPPSTIILDQFIKQGLICLVDKISSSELPLRSWKVSQINSPLAVLAVFCTGICPLSKILLPLSTFCVLLILWRSQMKVVRVSC